LPDYCIIGKTLAKAVGDVSERELQLFFTLLEGRRNSDWHYTSNGVVIEWRDNWSMLDQIKSHSIFRIMPVAVIPPTTYSTRLSQFNAMPSKPISNDKATGKWFEKHTQQRDGENDLEFEYRIIRTLAAVFRGIKRSNLEECSQ